MCYRVERELGQGGMGKVYVAIDEKFEGAVRVAIKLAVTRSDDERKRFRREARIGRQLMGEVGFVRTIDRGDLQCTLVTSATFTAQPDHLGRLATCRFEASSRHACIDLDATRGRA